MVLEKSTGATDLEAPLCLDLDDDVDLVDEGSKGAETCDEKQASPAAEDVALVGAGPVVHLDKAMISMDISGPDTAAVARKAKDDVELVGGAPAIDIDSGSESSSSSSSSARSRSRGRRQAVGAAAGAAVVTASAPLDIEESERIMHRELLLPATFAMELQHEGGIVALMSETGSVIGVSPEDSNTCRVQISGTTGSIAKAVWQLEQMQEQRAAAARAAAAEAERKAETEYMEELKVPASRFGAVSSSLVQVREKCGGIMIAVQPPSEPGGALTAIIGPGRRVDVLRAKNELEQRILPAGVALAPASAATASKNATTAASARSPAPLIQEPLIEDAVPEDGAVDGPSTGAVGKGEALQESSSAAMPVPAGQPAPAAPA